MDDPSTDGFGFRDLVGLGALLVGSVVLGTVIGWALDAAFGTAPVLSIIGIGVGITVGLVGGWLEIRRFLA